MPETEEDTENIYNKEDRKQQMEEDEIDPQEAGFMEGYEDTKFVECNSCEKSIDLAHVIEKEINGTTYTFCSKECAEKYEKEHPQE